MTFEDYCKQNNEKKKITYLKKTGRWRERRSYDPYKENFYNQKRNYSYAGWGCDTYDEDLMYDCFGSHWGCD